MNARKGPEALREAVRMLEKKLGVLDDFQSSCCGQTFAQCHALVEIGRARSISLNDLADVLGLDKSTMSRTITNLVNQGLAERVIDPDDRRFVCITLTENGLRSYRGIEESMGRYFTRLYEAIPADKREQVVESLEILLRALAEHHCCEEC